MALKLPKVIEGFKRDYYVCRECNQPQWSEYIPFSLGRGLAGNRCMCQCVGHNTHLLRKITRREFERRYRIWYNKHRRKYENKQTDKSAG